MHLLTKINGWTQQGPMGNDKQIAPWLVAAGISAGTKIIGGAIKRKQQKDLIAEQKKAGLKQLSAAGQMSAEEQQAMAQMKKGAKEGTMDVEGLQQQMSQPLYQQGEAQEATAQAKITQQGLEGSIIAQEVSRKVGSDVRASIADQARSIAYENEKTKADAQRRHQSALMKRGQLLREIAQQRAAVESGADIAELQSKQEAWGALADAGLGFAGAAGQNYSTQNWYQASEATHADSPKQWGKWYERPDD